MNMSRFPDVFAKLRAETDAALSRHHNTITMDMLENELPYTDAFIYESMRLFPPAIGLDRKVTQEIDLAGYKLIPGMIVLMNFWAVLRDKEEWGEDAEEFKPERWMSDNHHQPCKHRFANVLFSAGPRTCIGWRFSILEQKIFLCRLIQKFECVKTHCRCVHMHSVCLWRVCVSVCVC